MSDVVQEQLITRYRPTTFAQVVGHDAVLDKLQRAMSAPSHPHAYLITGVRGTGKTTIARIIASEFGCEIIPIDAATHSKVEEARQLVEVGQHMSLSGSGNRMFIIDEAHRLSASAVDALLAITEHPPPHLYFVLCTTDARRIPETMKSRCYSVHLHNIKRADLDALFNVIADLEGWTVAPDVMAAVVQAAEGSARSGISMLQSVHDCTDREEVRRIINLKDAGEPLIELCQLLLRGGKNWERIKKLLTDIDDDNSFDESSVIAARYMCGAMAKANSEADARKAWNILAALTFPSDTYDKKASFYTAIGRAIGWDPGG